MAKRTSNYKASAAEFGKRLTALYKLKMFPRAGKEFAEGLFKSGIEAGANISALSSISDAESKIRVAPDAIVRLNETAFAAQMMVEGGFYNADQIAPLNAYIEKLIEALSGLISAIKERTASAKPRRARTQRVIVEQKPVVKRRVIVRGTEELPSANQVEQIEEVKNVIDIPEDTASAETSDPDGFGTIYKK